MAGLNEPDLEPVNQRMGHGPSGRCPELAHRAGERALRRRSLGESRVEIAARRRGSGGQAPPERSDSPNHG